MRDGAAICGQLGGRRVRRGWKFRCPCHDDPTPSCVLRDDGLVTCFAGCDRAAVLAALDAAGFADDGTGFRPPSRTELANMRDDAVSEANQVWFDALREERDVAHIKSYLLRRKITWTLDTNVMRRHGASGYVVAARSLSGEVEAVQWRQGSERRSLGWLTEGAAVQLHPVGEVLGLAEGVETALSATQVTGVPCWATLSAGRLPVIAVPSSVKRIIIFPDNDQAGFKFGPLAAESYAEQGYDGEIRYPPDEYNDWNDLLTGNVTEKKRAL